MRTARTTDLVSIFGTILALALCHGNAHAGKGCATQVVFQNYEHHAQGNACLEIVDSSAASLAVTGIGSAGMDGMGVNLGDVTGPPSPGMDVTFDRLELTAPGSSFTGRLRGNIDGLPPGSTLMELHSSSDGSSVEFTGDFSAMGSQTHRVEIYDDGNLVLSVPGNSGPSVRIATPRLVPENWWIIKFGARCPYPSDIIKVCVDTDQDGKIGVELIATGIIVEGNEFRLIAENTTTAPHFFSTGEITAGGISEMLILATEVFGTPIDPCQEPESPAADVLFMNGKQGGDDGPYGVTASAGKLLWATMLLPASGGNGKFVVHANHGKPTPVTTTALPAQIGTACFPMLLSAGASPAAVWNNIGKESQVGSSTYFDGSPIANPDKAPAVFLLLHGGDAINLPVGTEVTFQGIIVDPSASSPKSASTTNALTLEVL